MSYTVGSFEVLHRKISSSDDPAAKKPSASHSPKTTVLQPGFRREARSRAIEIPTVWESDVIIPLRDGSRLVADLFRPEGKEKVPVILVWSPYGKSGTGDPLCLIHHIL